jgi:hypothetical protein
MTRHNLKTPHVAHTTEPYYLGFCGVVWCHNRHIMAVCGVVWPTCGCVHFFWLWGDLPHSLPIAP